MRSTSRLRLLGWLLVVALTTAMLVPIRGVLDKAHIALAYLLLVLVGTSRLGRRAGVALAVLCFVCFNFFLLPPYRTLVVSDRRDWLVLLAFLLSSLVAAQLLYRAQNEAAVARQRTAEINRLSTLGAETLSAGRAEEAIGSIARVIQATLDVGACEIYIAESAPALFRLAGSAVRPDYKPDRASRTTALFDYVVAQDAVVVERLDGAVHVLDSTRGASTEAAFTQLDARLVAIPLRVRDRAVGILRLADPQRVYLDAAQRRFAETLAYYAALAVERVRLTAEAERAEALHAADRIKDAFIAAVSHDLRTPLTTIKGLAGELGAAGDERARIIETEADRLNRLVEDLLDLSRLNAGALQLHPELNAAEDLIGAALNQLAGLPRAGDVHAQLPGGELILGRFDFVHSLRALMNLADNALKYSTAGSAVEITVARENGEIAFSVCDRGAGIAPADADRMFEPFVRAGGADRAQRGAGLGLAIAQRIAVAQGGSIRYAPRSGGGSVFTLYLPAADLPDLAPASSSFLTPS
ncbi:MAG TPA: ATP-binding protein [Longimicrobiales bacterium]|nr:ATP-binding protein [Longimicrobiales bacterium]